jgi:hypothetical protein
MTTPASNLSQLEKRLAELKAELERQRRSLSVKQTTFTIIIVLLVVIVAGYLTVVNRMISAELNADSLVQLAVNQAEPQIREQIGTLAVQAKENRHMLIGQASSFLKNQAPDMVFDMAMTSLQAIYAQQLADAEKQINDVIDAGVITAKETLKTRGVDLSNPEEFDKSAEQVAEIFAAESEARINDFYKKYSERSESFVAILDRLGEGKDLNAREAHYRELITSILAMLKRWSDESDKGVPVISQ